MSPILLPPLEAGLAGGDPLLAIIGTKTSQPRGLEAVLEFNGVYFHDLRVIDKYRLTKISGFHSLPDIRDAREVNPQAHGETAFPAFFGGRTIILEGRIEAHTIWKLRDMQQALHSAFSDLVERPLIIRTPSLATDTQIMCRCTSLVMDDQQTNLQHYREFQITLRASDPRFVRYTEDVYEAPFGILDDFSLDDMLDAKNLVTNPSFELGVDGWYIGAYDGANGQLVRETGFTGNMGTAWASIETASPSGLIGIYTAAPITGIEPGSPYTVSAHCATAGAGPTDCHCRMLFYTQEGTVISPEVRGAKVQAVGNRWTRAHATAVAPSNAASVVVGVWFDYFLSGAPFYVDGVQLERSSIATDYFDGSTPTTEMYTHRWAGAPHASISQRYAGDSLARRWSFDVGAGSVYVADGVLRASSTDEKRFYNGERTTSDWRTTMKFTTGATVPAATIGIILKRIDVSNLIVGQINPQTGFLTIFKYDNGAWTLLATTATPAALAPNTPYWLRGSIIGNEVVVERFTADPMLAGATPHPAKALFTLADMNATKYGAGRVGGAGVRLVDVPLDYSYDDFRSEPMSVSGDTTVFKIRNIGNFDALPVIRIYGHVENPIVKNISTNKSFQLNMTIPEGDYVELDFRNRTVRNKAGNNQYGKVPITSEFFGLQPQHLGENEITMGASAARGVTPALRIYHRDTWL